MEFLTHYIARFGRISRGTWLYRLIALGLLCTAFGMLAESLLGEIGAAVFAALFIWCAGAMSIQRLHDTGRSGWALLALLVPVLGPLWLLVQLLRRGGEGDNRFGADPMLRMDYLQVDISK
ncbi:MAG: DUF805 domain-containing protein [Burkholderiales bacterium]|nr:DUF805 domain-containing protein [Burkholderiales bacterium]